MSSLSITFFRSFFGVKILLTFLQFCSSGLSAQPLFKRLPDFPSFRLMSSDGTSFSSTDILKKNKPSVVIYFSPTCHHCQTQTQDLTSNMKSFKEVQFLFVTAYPPADTNPFLNEYAIEKFSNIRFGYDSSFSMGSFYELKSLPGVFIYDKQGKLKNHFDTNVKPEKLYAAIFDPDPGLHP